MQSGSSFYFIWSLLPLILVPALITLAKYNKKVKSRAEDAEKNLASLALSAEKLQDQVTKLTKDVTRLSPFSHIADVDVEAKKIVADANSELLKARSEVEHLLVDATVQSNKILEAANLKAIEIAGDAIEIRDDARRFERIVQAMKNKIDGYGNEYIVPSASLLDDLSASYSFTDAGQELKKARDYSKSMVKNKQAGDCDYVEVSRKETASDFVVDAFNGKVDSILSRVKHDNIGTLRQQIADAFTLVNHNGKAFRNARITDEYHKARLSELKWAVTAQELKMRDLEEQRLLREKIREEEKSQKEFERAVREAEKEEDTIKRAMERIRKETEQASAEQRLAFEGQLADLSEKLRLAEEKNQRAISMAQQTRTGHVYIISNIGSFGEDVVKIGMTRRLDPLDRVVELGDASVPFSFDVHAMIKSEDAPALEKTLHSKFLSQQLNKVNPRKEFFKLHIKAIKEEVEKLGISVAWTLSAEAREYRETIVIETMKGNGGEAANKSLDRRDEVFTVESGVRMDGAPAVAISPKGRRSKKVA